MRDPSANLLPKRLLRSLLWALLFLSGTTGLFAQSPRTAVTMNFNDATLMEVLTSIESQTDYDIVLSPPDVLDGISKHVRVVVTSGSVTSVLDGIFKNTPLKYTIDGLKITVTSKESNWVIVRGKVLDSDGEPLPGANVRVKGSKRGTTTDADGNYSLKVESLKSLVLVYSFVGMKSREVSPQTPDVSVTLQDDARTLTGVEVESTGYQDIDKRLSTSSVVTVKAADVLTNNVSTIDNMLLGKIPGMTVLTDVSTPGAAAKIRVRGVSTLSGSREPLWVVDGIILDDPVPLSAEEINSLDNINLIGNAISGLNPMDIEKIDILKDAAATAIYGVRAANGVIVVTTKKGTEGRFSLSYSGSLTYEQKPNYGQMNLMNSQERIAVSKEIQRRALPYPFTVSRVGYEGLLMDYYDRTLTEEQFLQEVKKLEETNTDWFDILHQNSFQQRHNLSVSGGTRALTYYASGNISANPDVVKDKGVTSYSGMLKLNFNPTPKVTAQLQARVNGSEKEYTYPGVSPYEYAYKTSRAIPAFDENGDRVFYNDQQGTLTQLRFNMMNELEHTGQTVKSNGFNVAGFLEYRPVTDLRISTTFGVNTNNTTEKTWFDELSYEAAKLRRINFGDPEPSAPAWKEEQAVLPYGGLLRSRNYQNLSWQWRAQVIYNWRFLPEHVLTINAGPEFRSTRYTGLSSSQYGYLPDRGESFMYINPAEWPAYNDVLKTHPDIVTNRLSNFISLFANLTYSYRMKYVMTFNVRAEGSNKFGQDPKARFLPIWSLSGRWNIHNEDFMKEATWINMLGLKASYGLQGNVSDEQTPNLIMRYGDYDPVSGLFQSYISTLPNPLLKWEKNTSYNIGIETALFDNRLTFSFDWYRRIGTDQLINKSVSRTVGNNSIQINAGTLKNEGFDFSLTAVPVRTKDWTWTLSFNGSRNTNEVTDGGVNSEITYNDYLNGTIIRNGLPVNTFFSYQFDGLSDGTNDLDVKGKVLPGGMPKFKGLNTERPEGETKEEFFASILKVSGQRVPLSQGGIGTSVRWKDLTFNLFFSYSLGNKVRLNNLYSNAGQTTPKPQQNMSKDFVDRWQKPGDEKTTNIPALTNNRLDDVAFSPSFLGDGAAFQYDFALNRWQMYNYSDLRVADGSHLRLRTASVSYNLPKKWITGLGLSHANVRLEGYNLFLIASKELRGQDPAQMSFGSRAVPPLPSYSFSLNLSF